MRNEMEENVVCYHDFLAFPQRRRRTIEQELIDIKSKNQLLNSPVLIISINCLLTELFGTSMHGNT